MLYRHTNQWQLQYDFTLIPQWLLIDYLKYMLNSPRLFHEVGEAENHFYYMQWCVDYLHTSIIRNPDLEIWSSVTAEFSKSANFLPLYFNEKNLKDIYVKRAEILEFLLKVNGYKVNYEFGNRSINRKKIRLGILATHFLPAPETFAALPVYEYLSRDFEVILYSLEAVCKQM